MNRLRNIVEETNTLPGRIFDIVLMFLIFVSLITFSIETLPNLSPNSKYWLKIFEIVTVTIFSMEYLLRVIVAKKPLRFIFSFYGLIDIIAIVPFFFTGLDLRSARAFRLFRILRLVKLARYSTAIQRFKTAFIAIKAELVLFLSLTIILLFIASVGIYYFENEAQPEKFKSIFHCLWWALASLTTVGYGDIVPITAGGKIFTFFMLIIGLGIVAVPTGIVSSALTATRTEERKNLLSKEDSLPNKTSDNSE